MTSVPRPVADIFIRESKDDLAEGYAPERNEQLCRAKAAELGADVGRVFLDVAKRDEFDSPDLQEVIRRAEHGVIRYVISPSPDRLAGEGVRAIPFYAALKPTGCEVVYLNVSYQQSPVGDFHRDLDMAVAALERATTRARTQNGIRGKLDRQQPMCSGPTPYGLEKVYDDRKKPIGWKPRSPQFGMLRHIVHRLQTRTSQSVCNELNWAGVPTPRGKGFWRTGTISSLLDNKVYRGRYAFGERKKIIGRNPDGKRTSRMEWRDAADPSITRLSFEPFIPLDELDAAERACAQRRLDRRPRYADEDDPYTLRGRLVCGYGHGALHAIPTNGVRYYQCSQAFGRYAPKDKGRRCRLPVVPAVGIERLAWGEFLAATRNRDRVEAELRAVADPGGRAERHRRQTAAIAAEIETLTQRIVNSTDVMLAVGKGSTSWEHARQAIVTDEQRKDELAEKLTLLEAHAPVVMTEDDIVSLLAAWAKLTAGLEEAEESPSEQRAVYGLLRLQGTVVLDDGGVRLGAKHRFGADWTWGGRLVSNAKNPCGILLLHTTQRGLAVLPDSDPVAAGWLAGLSSAVSAASLANRRSPSATR